MTYVALNFPSCCSLVAFWHVTFLVFKCFPFGSPVPPCLIKCRLQSPMFVTCPSPLVFETLNSAKLNKLTVLSKLAGQWAHSSSAGLWLQVPMCYPAGCFRWFWGSDSGAHVCTPGILPTESSLISSLVFQCTIAGYRSLWHLILSIF